MIQEGSNDNSEEDLFATFTAPVPLRRFMELMKNDSAKEFVRKMNKFLGKFEQTRRSPQEDSAAIQGFLEKMEGEFRKHKVWRNTPPHELNLMMEGVEKYLTLKLYNFIFGRYKEDRERDQMLGARMAALQFVQPSHLDIPEDLVSESSLILAVKELQKMNGTKCPRDKLVCILNCCKIIINLLRQAGRGGDGADVFVPVLNYVVIRCQPEKLISNIEYIKRFRMASRLVSLAEYYFMQLSVSALFIETANAKSFTGGHHQFLTSFRQHGLISQHQFVEAMEESNGGYSVETNTLADTDTQKHKPAQPDFAKPPMPPSIKTEESSKPDYTDNGSMLSSELSCNRSPHDQMEVNWERISSYEELHMEGVTLLTQHVAEGGFARKYPLMKAGISSLSVGQMEALAAKYRCMVLSYEILREAAMHKDSATIIRLLRESSEGRHGSSIWPSDGVLLRAYPLICAQPLSLTLGDASQLFIEYKELILKYEILELALKRRVRKAHWAGGDSSVLPELDPELFNNQEPGEAGLNKNLMQSTRVPDEMPIGEIEVKGPLNPSESTFVDEGQHSSTLPLRTAPEIEGNVAESNSNQAMDAVHGDELVEVIGDLSLEAKTENKLGISPSGKGSEALDPGNLIDMETTLSCQPEAPNKQDLLANQTRLMLE